MYTNDDSDTSYTVGCILIDAWEIWELYSNPDGSISGTWRTNDDEDRGHQSTFAEDSVSFKNYEAMKKRTGLTHFGVSGVKVTVLLDGQQI